MRVSKSEIFKLLRKKHGIISDISDLAQKLSFNEYKNTRSEYLQNRSKGVLKSIFKQLVYSDNVNKRSLLLPRIYTSQEVGNLHKKLREDVTSRVPVEFTRIYDLKNGSPQQRDLENQRKSALYALCSVKGISHIFAQLVSDLIFPRNSSSIRTNHPIAEADLESHPIPATWFTLDLPDGSDDKPKLPTKTFKSLFTNLPFSSESKWTASPTPNDGKVVLYLSDDSGGLEQLLDALEHEYSLLYRLENSSEKDNTNISWKKQRENSTTKQISDLFSFVFPNRTRTNPSEIRSRLKVGVLSVNLPEWPEQPHPYPLLYATQAYAWLVKDMKIDPSDIIIMGDGLGANISLALSLCTSAVNLPPPASVLLHSPLADLTCDPATRVLTSNHSLFDSIIDSVSEVSSDSDNHSNNGENNDTDQSHQSPFKMSVSETIWNINAYLSLMNTTSTRNNVYKHDYPMTRAPSTIRDSIYDRYFARYLSSLWDAAVRQHQAFYHLLVRNELISKVPNPDDDDDEYGSDPNLIKLPAFKTILTDKDYFALFAALGGTLTSHWSASPALADRRRFLHKVKVGIDNTGVSESNEVSEGHINNQLSTQYVVVCGDRDPCLADAVSIAATTIFGDSPLYRRFSDNPDNNIPLLDQLTSTMRHIQVNNSSTNNTNSNTFNNSNNNNIPTPPSSNCEDYLVSVDKDETQCFVVYKDNPASQTGMYRMLASHIIHLQENQPDPASYLPTFNNINSRKQ